MKKFKIIVVTLIIIFGLVLFFRDEILDFYSKLTLKLPEIEKEVTGFLKEEVEKEISLPPPLRVEKEYPEAFLTQAGVIKWTNIEREKYGLPPLKENLYLNTSSVIKVEDMFENQYFAHTSPSGEEISDLADIAGYEFILIGENLALGNFKNDEALVEAWMESPGHRENILNSRYQEIGIAVKNDLFEGKSTWIAVQHFGLPISACPQPDEKFKVEIETNENEIEEIEKTLKLLQIEIKNIRPKRGLVFEQKIEQYNALVSEYNALVNENKTLINEYNSQIKLFNECVIE